MTSFLEFLSLCRPLSDGSSLFEAILGCILVLRVADAVTIESNLDRLEEQLVSTLAAEANTAGFHARIRTLRRWRWLNLSVLPVWAPFCVLNLLIVAMDSSVHVPRAYFAAVCLLPVMHLVAAAIVVRRLYSKVQSDVRTLVERATDTLKTLAQHRESILQELSFAEAAQQGVEADVE